MGENIGNTVKKSMLKRDGYEVKLWCKALNMTPSELFSTPKEEIKNRLKNLKRSLRVNLAKNLMAYQKKKLDLLEKTNAALNRAKSNAPKEDYCQEEYKQNVQIEQTFKPERLSNVKTKPVGVARSYQNARDLPRIKAGGYVSATRRVVGDKVYETSRRVDGNNMYESKSNYTTNRHQMQRGPQYDPNYDDYYRGRAGGNVAGRALAQACEDMCPQSPPRPPCPKLFESYKGTLSSDTESSEERTDPQRPRARSLPFNATPPGDDDACYGIRGFEEMEMRDSNIDEPFDPHPVLQSTPGRPLMMRPVIQQVGSFVADVSEDSLEMADINVSYESNPGSNTGKLQITTRSYITDIPEEGDDYGNQSCPGQIENYDNLGYSAQGYGNQSCPAEVPGENYGDQCYDDQSYGGQAQDSYTLGEKCPCPANRVYGAAGSTATGGSPCPTNRTYNGSGGGSPCPPNRTYNASGGGSPCPPNRTYNASGGGSPCAPNRTYNASGGGSPCPPNRTYNASGGGSPCPPNRTYSGSGGRSPCPPNRTYNASGGGSPCPPNRTYNASGSSGCGSPCPLNRTRNVSGNACAGNSTFDTCATWDVSANRCPQQSPPRNRSMGTPRCPAPAYNQNRTC